MTRMADHSGEKCLSYESFNQQPRSEFEISEVDTAGTLLLKTSDTLTCELFPAAQADCQS